MRRSVKPLRLETILNAGRRYLQYCPKIVTIAPLKRSRNLQAGVLLEEMFTYRDQIKQISFGTLRSGP